MKGSRAEMMLSSAELLWPLLLKAPVDGAVEGRVTGTGQKASKELNLLYSSHFCSCSDRPSSGVGFRVRLTELGFLKISEDL